MWRTRISPGRVNQPLADERHEDDDERDEHDQVAAGDVVRQREGGSERDSAADARPSDHDRVLPRRIRIVLANPPEQQPRDIGRDGSPHEPAHDDRDRDEDAVDEQ
jgi:hypothetical protein